MSFLSSKKGLAVLASGLLASSLAATSASAAIVYSENFGTPASNTNIDVYTGFQVTTVTWGSAGATQVPDVRTSLPSTGYPGASGSGNVFWGTAGGNLDRAGAVTGIDASDFENLVVSFGFVRGSGTPSTDVTFEYSINNGASWTPIDVSGLLPDTGTTWLTSKISIPLPPDADGTSQLGLKWSKPASSTVSFRIDDLVVEGDDTTGGPITPVFTAYPVGPSQLYVTFQVPPSISVNPSDFVLNDAAGGFVNIATPGLNADEYVLTLSGPASGDLTLDTLGYINLIDNPADTSNFYAGIVPLSTLRAAVLADGNFLPTIPGVMAVSGVVVENVLDPSANISIQQGSAGMALRDASAFNLPAAVAEGDEIIFTGTFSHFNGLQQILAAPGLITTLGGGNVVTPVAINAATATAADYEAAESARVIVSNLQYEDAGATVPDITGSGLNFNFVGTAPLFAGRFDIGVELVFEGLTYPTGTVSVGGVMGQFDNSDPRNEGYQIFPIVADDLNATPASVTDWLFFQ